MGQCTRTTITAEVLISYNTALFHKKMLLTTSKQATPSPAKGAGGCHCHKMAKHEQYNWFYDPNISYSPYYLVMELSSVEPILDAIPQEMKEVVHDLQKE